MVVGMLVYSMVYGAVVQADMLITYVDRYAGYDGTQVVLYGQIQFVV